MRDEFARPYGAGILVVARTQGFVRHGGLHPGLFSVLPPGGSRVRAGTPERQPGSYPSRPKPVSLGTLGLRPALLVSFFWSGDSSIVVSGVLGFGEYQAVIFACGIEQRLRPLWRLQTA